MCLSVCIFKIYGLDYVFCIGKKKKRENYSEKKWSGSQEI